MAIHEPVTFLWFDKQALDAATFYVGLFPDSRIVSVSHYQEGAQKPAGTVLTVEFTLMGRPWAALNGGPQFPHSEAVSFQVMVETQDEVDRLWDALVANGGEESMCGWCRDRFGVSWQVIPRALGQRLSDPDPDVSRHAWTAMMGMRPLTCRAEFTPPSPAVSLNVD
jgi:predicted 3-demethylubiquinone-9 3-methyltransferase (glyoxalase superfamily)